MRIFNLPNFTTRKIPELNLDTLNLRDPDEVTNKILAFLKEHSKIAQRQFKTSRNLIIATVVIMFFQIVIALITINRTDGTHNNLIKIIETQSQQSEVISKMSLNLLNLQNQINTLEKEKKELLLKLNSK